MFRRFFVFIVSFFIIGQCWAGVQQCVDINPNVICTMTDECYNVSDCGVDCAGVSTRFVAQCASSSGTADEDVLDDLQIDDTFANNMNCWCKMILPLTTKWVLRAVYSSGRTCMMYCARGCANAWLFDMETDKKHRGVMMGAVDNAE